MSSLSCLRPGADHVVAGCASGRRHRKAESSCACDDHAEQRMLHLWRAQESKALQGRGEQEHEVVLREGKPNGAAGPRLTDRNGDGTGND